jgi:poly [ADP-ribose] polymerase
VFYLWLDAYVEKSYQPDSDDEDDEMEGSGSKQSNKGKERADDTPDSSLAKPVQNLMELIFNQKYQQDALLSMNYDTEKMPLGKLSKGTISRGFQALKDLAAVINTPGQAQVEPISNRYYSLIPHAFGRNRPPSTRTSVSRKRSNCSKACLT